MNRSAYVFGVKWTRTIRVEKGKELTENELNAALAVPKDDRLWRALHQLIDTAEANAHENAWASMDPPVLLAGYVGGAAHLKMLREELLSRREDGIKLMGGEVNRPEVMKE
jgi:hypothetical protein